MGLYTEIAWCDSTCNPAVGCDGCELLTPTERHCYAAPLVRRYAGAPGWPQSFDRPKLALERIASALKWPDLTGKPRPDKPWLDGYPRIIFMCDLGDPFTESLPLDWLVPYLPAIAASPHIIILLTKRPQRSRKLFDKHDAPKNLWLGTTVTSPATLWRLQELWHTRVSVRLLSLEPLLAGVDLSCIEVSDPLYGKLTADAITGSLYHLGEKVGRMPALDGVFLGGESGPGARPMHPCGARGVREQCVASGVPFFFKQWGNFSPASPYWEGCSGETNDIIRERALDRAHILLTPSGYQWDIDNDGHAPPEGTWIMHPIGKRAAGRLLDGREWTQMPEVRRTL